MFLNLFPLGGNSCVSLNDKICIDKSEDKIANNKKKLHLTISYGHSEMC